MKDFQFYNIFPCVPGDERQSAQDMIEYQRKTGHDIALYCLTLHPEGRPASNKAALYTESYRKVKAALAGSDVKLGILVQSILGHWPRVDKDEEPWTRSINIKGEPVRYCPLDPDFRNYIFTTIATLAKEKPVLFMGDDDIRSYSHEAECFCPLHVARFNEMTGKTFDGEQMREAVANCAVGDDIFVAFRALQQEMVDGVAALIREAIDSVDPSIPGASCMSYAEMRFHNTISKAIAAKGQPPMMRICNSYYCENSAKTLPHLVLLTQALRDAHKDVPVAIEESDTFPHSLYSKSSVSMNAKFIVSIMSDVFGGKTWYINAHKSGLPVNGNYADIIGEYDGLYQELTRTVRGSRKTGVAIPFHRRFLKWHPLRPSPNNEFFVDSANWGERAFGLFGIPFYGTFDLEEDSVYALAGSDAIRRLDDEELMTLLKGKVIVDGPAAVELCARGFGEHLGVSASFKDMAYRFDFNDITGQQYPISKQSDIACLEVRDASVQVMSSLCYAAYSNSPEREKVAPSTVIYRNSLGGTVGVAAISIASMPAMNMWTDARKLWIVDFLDLVNGVSLPNVVMADQNVVAMCRRSQDGADVLAVFNVNFDPMETVEIRGTGEVHGIQRLAPDGTWVDVGWERRNGNIVIPERLECYRFLVLKIS